MDVQLIRAAPVRGPADYTTWNVGVGSPLTGISLDLRDLDTHGHDLGAIHDSRAVGGLKLSF